MYNSVKTLNHKGYKIKLISIPTLKPIREILF